MKFKVSAWTFQESGGSDNGLTKKSSPKWCRADTPTAIGFIKSDFFGVAFDLSIAKSDSFYK
jgi:hypothetical protein